MSLQHAPKHNCFYWSLLWHPDDSPQSFELNQHKTEFSCGMKLLSLCCGYLSVFLKFCTNVHPTHGSVISFLNIHFSVSERMNTFCGTLRHLMECKNFRCFGLFFVFVGFVWFCCCLLCFYISDNTE